MVKVKLSGVLKKRAKQSELEIVGVENIKELFKGLAETLGSIQLQSSIVMVNGVEISALSGGDTPINNHDEVTILLVVHGG